MNASKVITAMKYKELTFSALSPLLHSSNTIVGFADDTTVVGLISGGVQED